MSSRRKPNSRNPGIAVRSTGLQIEAKHKHHATIPDVPPGEHLWMALGMWRLADPTSPNFNLDIENLMTIEGPGCFICEAPYSPEMAGRPCPGEPA